MLGTTVLDTFGLGVRLTTNEEGCTLDVDVTVSLVMLELMLAITLGVDTRELPSLVAIVL